MQRDEIDRYEVGPFEIVAYAVTDEDMSLEAWIEDPTLEDREENLNERYSTLGIAWWFIGVEVVASLRLGEGEEIILGRASVWGVESDADEYIDSEIIPRLAEEAIIEAKTHLRKIEESLKAIHLDNLA